MQSDDESIQICDSDDLFESSKEQPKQKKGKSKDRKKKNKKKKRKYDDQIFLFRVFNYLCSIQSM